MKKQKKEKNALGNWKTLFGTVKRLKLPWVWIIIGLTLNLTSNDILLKIPDTTADLLSGNLTSEAVIKAITYYVMFAICAAVSVAGQAQAQSYGVKRARDSIWQKMLGMKMEHFDKNDPSDVMSTIINDASAAVLSLINVIIYVVPSVYYVVMAMQRISEYHWGLALSCFILFPLKYLYALIMGKTFEKTSATLYEKIGFLTSYLADRINNLPLIKTYTNEEEERKNGNEAAHRLMKINMKMVHIDNIATGVVSVIDVLQKFAVVVVAVILLQKNLIDMAMWLAFFLFSQNLFSYVDQVFDSWVRIKMVKGSFKRIVEVMYGETEKNGSKPFPENGDIRFLNVTFTYPEADTPALKNVSFTVKRGESVAIVGLCGSGKTTAVSLLECFYTAEDGGVFIGDTDIRELSLGEYRKHISYVQQGAGSFSGTLREALTYGIDREISDAEITEASKKTGFFEYIELFENSLDTPVTPGGASMSGGQGQRLALTRELLRGGDIILMDEPTSALDAVAAKKVEATINTAFCGKTKILITHDLDLAKSYGKIIVLLNGEIVGEGSHDELLLSCETYRHMTESVKEAAVV